MIDLHQHGTLSQEVQMPNYKGVRRQFTTEEREAVRRRYLGGEGVETLAEELGCASTTIYGFVRGLITTRAHDSYEETLARLRGLRPEDTHWVAGIVDGEGWIGIGRNNTFLGPRVSVSSTDPFMVPELLRLLGGNTCVKTTSGSRWRNLNCWDLYTLPTVRAFCEVFQSTLRVKHEQARLLAMYCDLRMVRRSKRYTSEERAIVAQLHKLNQRGVECSSSR